MSQEQDILVEVKGVSKKFSRSLKQGMLYGLKDMFYALFGLKGKRSQLRKGEFWAVKEISFSLRRGECLGLIGHNGAGKSTLLKMLNGLIRPDEGSITMNGKVGALIELGAGFNPLLTGRENIYINGQLLGFTKKEVNEKFQAILDFADIGEFIDSPVQNYSSGMKVRLGFAIAAQMEPDILIIDEVLAVGDMEFVIKCFNAIDKLLPNTAIIFVSHSMPMVSRMCSLLLLMDKGKLVYLGKDVGNGIDLYYSDFNVLPSYVGNNEVEIRSIYFNDKECFPSKHKVVISRLDDIKLQVTIRIDEAYVNPYIYIVFYDKELRGIAEYFYDDEKTIINRNGEVKFEILFPEVNFSKGVYSMTIGVRGNSKGEILFRAQSIVNFQVISKLNVWTSIQLKGIMSQVN